MPPPASRRSNAIHTTRTSRRHSNCGASLEEIAANNLHKRQVFEIENGTIAVIEHRLAAKLCPACGSISRGQFPLAVKAPVQYGASVLSRTLYLHLYQLLPVARTQEAMRDLFGCDVSQASVQRAARFCSDKLIRCEQRIKRLGSRCPHRHFNASGFAH